jgi:release factor glutamine methyltransferase
LPTEHRRADAPTTPSSSEPAAGRTVAGLLEEIAARFADAGIASPRAEARWLLRHVLGRSSAQLVQGAADVPDADQVAELEHLAGRRATREPLQLVLGATAFRGHELTVRPGVFVPRPETELLVEHGLERLPTGAVVVEPCTGSGAVACAIAAERPDAQVIATDIDADAVALAAHNAARLGVTVEVWQGDLLDPVPRPLRGRVDLLVCNPPYIAADEVADLPPEVAVWDPAAALVAGPTGHEVSDRLITLAVPWLRSGGRLLLELDERRVVQAADRALAAGLRDADALVDLTGRVRYLTAQLT